MKYLFVFLLFLLVVANYSCQQPNTATGREILLINQGWKFVKADFVAPDSINSLAPDKWQEVNLPHDWAIAGPFDVNIDTQTVAVWADGEKKPALQTGRTGGLPYVGTGWYTKTIVLNQNDLKKRIFIEFDGAMSHAKVFVNNQFAGTWPYGYASFSFDITDIVHSGENKIAVRLQNLPNSSRWYPGAGIYRDVRLVKKPLVHVGHWGTFVTTPQVTKNKAQVKVSTQLVNATDNYESIKVQSVIMSQGNNTVATTDTIVNVKNTKELALMQLINIENPKLWDIESPNMYTLVTNLYSSGQLIDSYTTPFGIRQIEFDKDNGFMLNQRHVPIKGVCLHHDLGPLGIAINKSALHRKLKLLKHMGCNAIRTSHNPPSPQLLELCDQMGFLVMDEAFDEWKEGKVKNGYSVLFDKWAEKDLKALIKRDRNHPSIIMWSIGNEIKEQNLKGGGQLAKWLTQICHQMDSTRPVTAGFNYMEGSIENGLADAVDIVGWNYKPSYYAKLRKEHPNWIMLGSETASTVSSRGAYFFPVERTKNGKQPSLQLSSYDLTSCSWSTSPDEEFIAQEENPFIMGEFVWTGTDYLGEPSPYKIEWPSRSSYFGIIDLCGIPKDRYYLYQTHWTNKPVLHLLPHWNWPNRVGKTTPVFCYTNYDSVELFVNGKSEGFRKFNTDTLINRYRLVWENVVYQPGTIKAVAYQNGKIVAEKTIKTAGKPHTVQLIPDSEQVKADPNQLLYIEVNVTDAEGNLCPTDNSKIAFEVRGQARIEAVGNGDATSLELFKASYRKAFNGKCMLIIRPLGKTGAIAVTAKSEGLQPKTINLIAN